MSFCGLEYFFSFFVVVSFYIFIFFFFKQKTAYEMRISDWSSDVCSSDLSGGDGRRARELVRGVAQRRSRRARTGNRKRSCGDKREIGRASCRERVCQYV